MLDSQKEFPGKLTRIDLDKHRIYIETED
ncbi:MAG: CooT family nickel-binding protein [Methanothermobacter wolfeii]|nr:CooT family nickel-binding protein [Methanothermobacter wolfeii]